MQTKTEAIVLHAIKYGESRMVADLFTRHCGRQSFIVSFPKSQRSKFRRSLFQPLTLLYIEYDQRAAVQLQKFRDVALLTPLPELLSHPDKLSISLFVAEFLYYALRGEQRNEPLFDYVLASLRWLDGSTGRFSNFHLVFLMRLSRFLGFYPNLEGYSDGCCFDLRESHFCTHVPLHRDFLPPAEARLIQLMMRMDYNTMHLFRLSQADRKRLLEVAIEYYRLHLPDFPELRSLQVLHQLYTTTDSQRLQ